MVLGSVRLETITEKSFAPFGTLVDWTPALEESGRPFHILVRSEVPTGWRLAVLKVAQRAVERLENHPHSEELFAPLEGRAILVVAEPGEREDDDVHAFFLDRPVSVAPGVWHDVFSLSEFATILIAENLEVSAEYSTLSRPVGAIFQ
ncbi:MAG: ureidoglycolate lyase [Chloroflexota bacterium]|nr:ureidoglycolate lyase [Chloroflexota bacterium]